jgi:hypothetical protein
MSKHIKPKSSINLGQLMPNGFREVMSFFFKQQTKRGSVSYTGYELMEVLKGKSLKTLVVV